MTLKKTLPWLANTALLALWVFLYRAIYPYFAILFTREEFRTNQIVLLGAAALIVYQVRKGGLKMHLGELPRLHRPALALALVGSLLYLLAERFLNINTLSGTLFGLASYGLLGLWMNPMPWRQGLPAALLLIGALPFGEHMQTFIGYPVRLVTAAAVRDGLSALGFKSLGVDTILVFETGISKVDLPCSGVKSLWTGGLFYLAATWIERRKVSWRWLLAGVVFGLALLAANLLRVAILVLVGQIEGWRLLAEMLHVPLGVLGFVGACGLGLLMLRGLGQLPEMPGEAPDAASRQPVAGRQAWLALALGITLMVMGLLYAPRPAAAAPNPSADFPFPAQLNAQPWQLTQGEREWLAEAGVQSAQRWRFTWQPGSADPLTGSMLIVTSNSWRAHHRPERCFEVYGLTVDQSTSLMAAADFPVRALWLSTRQPKRLMTAAYWLQSGERATDDYATRIWADLSPERQPWVLVTVLFDTPVEPGSPEALALYRALRQSAASR